MRLPAYLLLPIVGAVALIAAVMGAWLWPEPAVPSPSPAPAGVVAPVAVQPSPPAPAFTPPQPRPMARPAPARSAEPPPQPVAQPVVMEPPPPPPPAEPPPGPTTSPRMADWSPETQARVKKNWMNIKERAGEMAMVGVKQLERQRDEAKARGDQAEFKRLDQLARSQREAAERMMRAQQAVNPGPSGPSPQGQAGSPLQ